MDTWRMRAIARHAAETRATSRSLRAAHGHWRQVDSDRAEERVEREHRLWLEHEAKAADPGP